MEAMLEELLQEVSRVLPRVALGLLIFVGFWLAGWVLQKVIGRVADRSDLGQDLLSLIQRAIRAGFLIFGAVTALGTVGVNVSALVAGLGLMGFALGFALRDVLSNLLAGVLILIYRPFQRNDRIAVSGFEGTVIEIGLRYTALKSDDKTVLIPNSTLFTNPISILEAKR